MTTASLSPWSVLAVLDAAASLAAAGASFGFCHSADDEEEDVPVAGVSEVHTM